MKLISQSLLWFLLYSLFCICQVHGQENRLIVATSSPVKISSYTMDGQQEEVIFENLRTDFSLSTLDAENKMLYRTKNNPGIFHLQRLNLETGELTSLDSFSQVFGDLFFDKTNQRILFALDTNKYIFSYSILDERVDTIIETTIQPRSVGYLQSTNTLLWSGGEINSQNIYAVNLTDQSSTTIYTSNTYVDNIIVDQTNQTFIFAAERKIVQSNFTGTQIDTLYSFPMGQFPFGLALDKENNQLYWTDYGVGEVRKGPIDGGNYTTIISNLRTPIGLEIVALELSTSTKQPILAEASNLKIYPQPAQNWVNVKWQGNNFIESVTVLNAQGKIILTSSMKGNQEKIDISALSAGLYYIQTYIDNTFIVEKLLIH